MKEIPTAQQFLRGDDDNEPWTGDIEDAMIEFAKLHTKAALKAASENVMQYGENVSRIPVYNVDKESILNAYPETLIK